VSILVTGSAGHLGEALLRVLRESGNDARGLDMKSSPFTDCVGSITERDFVRRCIRNVEVVLHTATLHKPHIATHTRQAFIDTNVTGTLNLLEEAAARGVSSFIFTSTTSVFGHSLRPADGEPARWITEEVAAQPRNIYGITKLAAEQLCELVHRKSAMPCVVLRTSRFFPEEDDDPTARETYPADNLKVNEFLYRRADIADVVAAHIHATRKAREIGFGRYIISATTPFDHSDLQQLRIDPSGVARRHVPDFESVYARRGWKMPPGIDRVYVNERARTELEWHPTYDFAYIIRLLGGSEDYRSELARSVGSKGYHAERFAEGPYPTEKA
jgi:UDP-glucose 4-epimerase